MEKQLDGLVQKLTAAFEGRLVSVILYGSAAAGDWQEGASDLNVLCVLNEISLAELKLAEPIFGWWSKQGNLPPVLMSQSEIQHSADCFPIEFHDIHERRRVLMGRDIAADLNVDFKYYRAFVERELRTKRIRLRQKSVELLGQHDRLVKLMLDSVSTFCALGRHALILSNRAAKWKKQEILAAITDATGSPLSAANQLLVMRETGKKPPAADVMALLEQYLRDTAVIVNLVDSLEKQ